MTLFSIIIAFLIGFLFVIWLASRQAGYQPMFTTQGAAARSLWWIVIVAGLIGIVTLTYVGFFPVFDQSGAVSAIPTQPQPHAQARMLIPTLNVNEKIVNVPIKSGEWDISRLSNNIGWLVSTGDSPSNEYAMTFIGHVTISSVEKGPFADLYKIKPLSEIIYRNSGVDFVYAVETLTPVLPTEVSKLFQRKKEHLILVTCTDYDLLTSTYKGRLIVDAVLVQRKIAPTQTSN
mgnify:FL=1